MLKYTFKKTTRTANILLVSAIGIASFTVSCLTHTNSEPNNNQNRATKTHLSEQSKITSQQATQTATSHNNTQEVSTTEVSRNQRFTSITRYACLFAKMFDLIGHAGLISIITYALYDESPKDSFHIVAKLCGLIGTTVLLIKSIKNDLKKPLPLSPDKKFTEECHAIEKENENCLSDTHAYKRLMLRSICGLLGIMGYGWILKEAWNKQKLEVALFATPNIGFLAHSLFGDYKSYIPVKK